MGIAISAERREIPLLDLTAQYTAIRDEVLSEITRVAD